MNKRTTYIFALFVALAATAVGVPGAKPKGKAVKSGPFTVTAMFSGTLSGEIVVNGQSIFINDKTSFHKVGKGPVEKGESVSNSAVFIGGVTKGKRSIATMVIIGEPETSNDFSQTTIEGAE